MSSPDATALECRIVPEIFQVSKTFFSKIHMQDYNSFGYKQAKADLESALTDGCNVIIIEPMLVGDETSRAIKLGNACHKSTVVCGSAGTLIALVFPNRWQVYVPVCCVSLFTYSMYTVFWQHDPCSKYQVERDQAALATLDYRNVNAQSVVVLRRRDDTHRKYLHTGILAVTIGVCVYRIYELLN